MGEYLEEILDNNDLVMDLMASLDESMRFDAYHYADARTPADSIGEPDTDGCYTL